MHDQALPKHCGEPLLTWGIYLYIALINPEIVITVLMYDLSKPNNVFLSMLHISVTTVIRHCKRKIGGNYIMQI